MKILGISGSPRKEGVSGVHALVEKVLAATGMETELVSLRGKKISGCIACLGCVKDNICKQADVTARAEKAGQLLVTRLSEGHDRAKVAGWVKEKMMAMMGEAV